MPTILERARHRKAQAQASAAEQKAAASKRNDEALERAEELLKAANDGSSVARNLYITFILFALYLAISVGGVTDEMLLRDTGIAIPLLDKVELPVHNFFAVAPWLFVLLHFETLLHFSLLARKLFAFEAALTVLDGARKDDVRALRNRVANFPFLHWLMRGDGEFALRSLEGLALWVTLMLGPAVLLLFVQVAFLPYHSFAITAGHRVALVTDLVLVMFFWRTFGTASQARWFENIALIGMPRALLVAFWGLARRRPREGVWMAARERVRATWSCRARGTTRFVLCAAPLVALSIGVATIPEPEPGLESILTKFLDSRTLQFGANGVEPMSTGTCVFPFGLRMEVSKGMSRGSGLWKTPGTAAEMDDTVHAWLPDNLPSLCITTLLFHSNWSVTRHLHRSLSLQDKTLVGSPVIPIEAQKAMEHPYTEGDDAAKLRTEALKSITGLDLKNRDLRYADLRDSLLAKADFRYSTTRLDGADLTGAALWSAKLEESQLRGAHLHKAQLQGANLDRARLQRVLLHNAHLQGASLVGARLQGASLVGAQLHGANLVAARLEGADLLGAQLQGARLESAFLQGARLLEAGLQGADLNFAQLQGADLNFAQLQGADLNFAQLQGANLNLAQLQGTSLAKATLILNATAGTEVGALDDMEARALLDRMEKIPTTSEEMKTRMSKAAARVLKSTCNAAAPWQPMQCYPGGIVCERPSTQLAGFRRSQAQQWAAAACGADGGMGPYVGDTLDAAEAAEALVKAFLSRNDHAGEARQAFATEMLNRTAKECPYRRYLTPGVLRNLKDSASVPQR